MTTVGFIGSGQIGSAIARLAIEAGHQVVLSNSRGPETLANTVAELGPRASAATSGAFNNIFFKHLLSLGRPAGAADRSYLPIAGDFAPAKAAVTEFIDSIGYSVVDAGPLADSWRQATGTPVWGTPYGPYSDEQGQPAGEDAIRAALAAATR
jgi:predicted dinucleotide-binding enzyme